MTYQLQFGAIADYLPAIWDGLVLSLLLSFLGIFGGFFLGLFCAIAAVSKSKFTRFFVQCYVEVMRNTPLLVQIFIIYFALPSIGIRFSPLTAAIIALILNNGGYIAEIIRGGLQATPKGQVEAAESIGLTYPQTLLYVVVPPAIERVYPPVVSQSVLLMLSTSLVSAIGVEELTGAAMIASSETFRTIEIFIAISIIYIALNYVFRGVLLAFGMIMFKRKRPKLLRSVWDA